MKIFATPADIATREHEEQQAQRDLTAAVNRSRELDNECMQLQRRVGNPATGLSANTTDFSAAELRLARFELEEKLRESARSGMAEQAARQAFDRARQDRIASQQTIAAAEMLRAERALIVDLERAWHSGRALNAVAQRWMDQGVLPNCWYGAEGPAGVLSRIETYLDARRVA